MEELSGNFIFSFCVIADFEGIHFVLDCHTWHSLIDETFKAAAKIDTLYVHYLLREYLSTFLASSIIIVPLATSPKAQQLLLMLELFIKEAWVQASAQEQLNSYKSEE